MVSGRLPPPFGQAPFPAYFIEEAATLVGMVNKPTRYNPVLNYESSLGRRNHVISQDAQIRFHFRQEADSIMALPIVLNYTTQDHNAGLAPYFRDTGA